MKTTDAEEHVYNRLFHLLHRFAVSFSNRYRRMNADDFISAGDEAFCIALQEYRADKGVPFEKFVSNKIYYYMQKEAARFYESHHGKFIPMVQYDEVAENYDGDNRYLDMEEMSDCERVEMLIENGNMTCREESSLRRRCLNNESSKDIARSFHCTPQTITADIRRAKEKMRVAA